VVNIRTAGAVSKCSTGNAIRILIRIRPNSLKPLFGTPLVISGTVSSLWWTKM